jgi:hypothetical protein
MQAVRSVNVHPEIRFEGHFAYDLRQPEHLLGERKTEAVRRPRPTVPRR